MKTAMLWTLFVLSFQLIAIPGRTQKKVTIAGQLQVGIPGQGDTLLTFNTDRPWMFRQLDFGPSTALELLSTIGLKNFVITTTGNLGVDVLAPSEKLHVNGSIKANGPRLSFGSSEYIQDAGSFLVECNGSLVSTLDNADNLGSSSRRWNSIWAVNGAIQTSDIKTKTDIQPIPYGLSTLMQLHPVSFLWAAHPGAGRKLGLVAQEVQPLIKEVVVDYDLVRNETTGEITKQPSSSLGMYYSDLIPVLIKAVQDQQQIISSKDAKLALMERRLEALESRLVNIEQSLVRPVNSQEIR